MRLRPHAGWFVVASVADLQALESPVARLALLVDLNWESTGSSGPELGREYIRAVRAVGNEEQALLLRRGRLLAWAKTKDVIEAGYSSWPAFEKEHSPWDASQTREYIRFANSRLDAIKQAASNHQIGITAALRALRVLGDDASREAQLAYIAEATFRKLPKRSAARVDRWSGDERRRILNARRLAAILIGWDAPLPVIDAFLLACRDQQLTGEQILERARELPPKPERLDRVVPDWKDDPAVSLVGPWVEPRDLRDVISMLRALDVVLVRRRLLLGTAYFQIRRGELWRAIPGCTSLAECCEVHLEISQRTFQVYASEGFDYECFPLLKEAIEAGGLSVDRATFVADRAPHDEAFSLRQWLDVARHLGRAELERARAGNTQREYRRVLFMAQTVEARRDAAGAERSAQEIGGDESDGPADPDAQSWVPEDVQEIGADAERVAEHLDAVGATGPIQIALRDSRRENQRPEPDVVVGPVGLLEAADYLLAAVSLDATHGVRRMAASDGFTCQNPRCRRRTLRVHSHHIVERQHGGTDEDANIVTLCPACHLRGIHSGHMSVVRIGDWLVWSWPSGGVVIMDSPVDR